MLSRTSSYPLAAIVIYNCGMAHTGIEEGVNATDPTVKECVESNTMKGTT